MSELPKDLLEQLKNLSLVDAKLARLKAEKLTLEKEVKAKQKNLELTNEKVLKARHAQQLKEVAYRKEERFVRDEQAKLVDRRKALQTLQSYKLQQAAEKEIEASSQQLNTQEEALILVLDEMEKLSATANELDLKLKNESAELQDFIASSEEAYKQFAERQEIYGKERDELAQNIGADILRDYQKVAERYPNDPVVIFKDLNCSGCYMTLGPQVMNEIGRAKGLVKCRGCGRILYIEQNQSK